MTLGEMGFPSDCADSMGSDKLPSVLRMETSLKPFKAKLKTLLFNEAYDL